MRVLLAALLIAIMTTPVRAADVSRKQIDEVIVRYVEKILAEQQADGSFLLGSARGPDAALYAQFPVGRTALGVLALQYAQPHLTGDLQARAIEAIRKGIANIVQQKPEQRTYSAGVILTVLYQESPERYRKLIDAYATMLVLSQHDKGDTVGEWGYRLVAPPGTGGAKESTDVAWGDNSNTQFALLGLYNAERAGFQVPPIVWRRAADHYVKTQFLDGGWGYKHDFRPEPYINMTIASTISLNLCEEMLYAEKHATCKPPPRSKPVEAGLKWIGGDWDKSNLGTDPYGLYAMERLAILMGRAEICGHDWYNEGARVLLSSRQIASWGAEETSWCFLVAFLSRGLEPIVVNKLERKNTSDWNYDPYDAKHLVEHLQDGYQLAVQWRIVTLEAPLDLLLKTPILYINGHSKLDFDPKEKTKLKDYVAGGGTLLAMACCGSKTFDASIRELGKELFGADFEAMGEGSRLFARMATKGAPPKLEVLKVPIAAEEGRPAILYLPQDQCCKWQRGGAPERNALSVGAGIYFYVVNECRAMYLKAHPEAANKKTDAEWVEQNPDAPKPDSPKTQPPRPQPDQPPTAPQPPDNPLIPPGLPPGF